LGYLDGLSGIPEPKGRPGGPGGARRSQEEPGGARRSQEEQGGARRSQEELGGPGSGKRASGFPPRFVFLAFPLALGSLEIHWAFLEIH
jgi:hypothetical protein